MTDYGRLMPDRRVPTTKAAMKLLVGIELPDGRRVAPSADDLVDIEMEAKEPYARLAVDPMRIEWELYQNDAVYHALVYRIHRGKPEHATWV